MFFFLLYTTKKTNVHELDKCFGALANMTFSW